MNQKLLRNGVLCLICLIALYVPLSRLAVSLFGRLIREEVVAVVKFVTIREGLTAVEISKLLEEEGIFVNDEKLPQELDGYLFPDTYQFYVPSGLGFVVKKINDNFNKKALPLIPKDKDINQIITVASLVEEEVITSDDRKIVAGIIWKRLKNRMPLQIDSSVCYVKAPPCYPIRKSDLEIDSPYNTYLYKGLPPGPISNPGVDAIEASIYPKDSPYWFYISDPVTKKTHFSVTLEEHNQKVVKYLK